MTLRRGLIAFLLIASGCTLIVFLLFAISWGEYVDPYGGGVREMNAEDFGRAVGWILPNDQTSGLVEVWFGADTFRAVAFLAPFFTLLLPLQVGWVRWLAAGIEALFAVLGFLLTLDYATNEAPTAWRLWFGLAVCTTLLALAVLHVVRRVGWAALVLAMVMGLAAILQAAALLDLQASIVQGPASAPGSIQAHGLGVMVPPPWLMSIGFALTAIGCAIVAPRRRRNEPSALGGAPTGGDDLLLGRG